MSDSIYFVEYPDRFLHQHILKESMKVNGMGIFGVFSRNFRETSQGPLVSLFRSPKEPKVDLTW